MKKGLAAVCTNTIFEKITTGNCGFEMTATAVQVAQAANGEQAAFSPLFFFGDEAVSSSLQLSHRQQGTIVSVSTTSDSIKRKSVFNIANLLKNKKKQMVINVKSRMAEPGQPYTSADTGASAVELKKDTPDRKPPVLCRL